MLNKRRTPLSNGYYVLFTTLLVITIFVTFSDRIYSIKLFSRSNYKTNQTTVSPYRYLNINFKFKSNEAQCSYHDNLIIYILSTVTNFQRRKLIRSTWGSPLRGTCFIFIIGKSNNPSSIQLRLNNEKRQYRDMVQIDYIESYANVIYKEIAALRWSHDFYPMIPYLFKTDDDLIVDSRLIASMTEILVTNLVDKTSHIMQHGQKLVDDLLSSNRPKFFRSGWVMENQPTLRQGKFRVSENVWSDPILPSYCSGFGWFMYKMVRNQLLIALNDYPINKIVEIGDVFLSGFVAREAEVKCTYLPIGYEQTSSGNCSCLMIQRPLLTVCSSSLHVGNAENDNKVSNEYNNAWKVIQQRHSPSGTTNIDLKDCS